MKSENPILPNDSWAKMILIGLGVLGLGMAIAWIGFVLSQH